MKHHIFRKTAAALIAALTLATASSPASAAITYTTKNQPYSDNFRDVEKDDWFYESVAEAYSLGIISGVSSTEYAPETTLDLASLIKLACCVHQLKHDGVITLGNGTGNWYDTYVAYALQNGIISEEYGNYSASASRAQAAVIFARVLDKDEPRINMEAVEDKPFPDVSDPSLWYYANVYKMYACGIMTGDQNGNFNPEGRIKRSEIAAVVVRMLDTTRRIQVNVTGESQPQTGTTPPKETPDYNGEPWDLLLYEGGSTPVAFTGLTGFSLIYDNGSVSGYSIDCINDVVISGESLSFYMKKNVGLTAMGIVRGWLNNAAAYVDGVRSEKTAAEMKKLLDSEVALYINGRKADISALTINKVDGDVVYTFAFADRYAKNAVTDVVLVCGEIPNSQAQLAKDAISRAADAPDPIYTGETTVGSSVYTAAIEKIKNDNYTALFQHETSRFMILYGLNVDTVDGSVTYLLQFVYPDGSVQEIARTKLNDIRVNDSGTVLYYTIPSPDGSSMEYGVNIGSSSGSSGDRESSSSSSSADSSSQTSETARKDIKGKLAGLNLTLSGKDSGLIALMEGELDVLFRGVYSNYATAFSIVKIAPANYYEYYSKHFSASEHNRIFALKDGNYYAVIYDSTADDRVYAAAERVIASVVSENTFDCVYEYIPNGTQPDTDGTTCLYLKHTNSDHIIADPFTWVDDTTAPNGFRIENFTETAERYSITADTEVWVLALDYSPVLKTTYGQFSKIWPLGSKWDIWRIAVDPATNTVVRLIQQYVP